jgi:L-aspartate oxidase
VAFRAGAELRDMEFMQFHPTVLYIAGSSRSLITEAIRGEGAYLVDRSGYRFMLDYDERGELAPRDVVSQAIVSQMEKTRHPCVFLDLSHLDPRFVRSRFPGINDTCGKFGIDITKDRIPVRPSKSTVTPPTM